MKTITENSIDDFVENAALAVEMSVTIVSCFSKLQVTTSTPSRKVTLSDVSVYNRGSKENALRRTRQNVTFIYYVKTKKNL